MSNEDLKRWLRSLTVSLLVFLLVSVYLFLRRGYYNLYIVNKVFGSTAVILAGITLLIGPLSRIFPHRLSRLMTIRRDLGLTAMGFAIAHVIASLLQQAKFPFPSWYLEEWVPVTFGLIALIMWVYLTTISKNSKIEQMGTEHWKRNLSIFGQLAFLSIFFHVTVMKYQGWIRWFQGLVKQTPELANPQYPPASLFVFIFMLSVIIFRVTLFFTQRSKHTAGLQETLETSQTRT